MYEILKGWLTAGLIEFSQIPWASPIVLVARKKCVDIRLRIDYKSDQFCVDGHRKCNVSGERSAFVTGWLLIVFTFARC